MLKGPKGEGQGGGLAVSQQSEMGWREKEGSCRRKESWNVGVEGRQSDPAVEMAGWEGRTSGGAWNSVVVRVAIRETDERDGGRARRRDSSLVPEQLLPPRKSSLPDLQACLCTDLRLAY